MAKGTVKWFSDQKGYGFIMQGDGGKDLFVHHSAIVMAGRRALMDGETVEYDVVDTEKGKQATNVRRQA